MTIVRCYRNLNKGGLSLKTKVDGKWKVTDYTGQAIIKNCKFRVSEKERERIASGGHKSVHAWIEGELVSTDINDFKKSKAPIPYYNPHTTKFFEIGGQEVMTADIVKVTAPTK